MCRRGEEGMVERRRGGQRTEEGWREGGNGGRRWRRIKGHQMR